YKHTLVEKCESTKKDYTKIKQCRSSRAFGFCFSLTPFPMLQRLEAIKEASQRKEVAFRLKVIEFHNFFGTEDPSRSFWYLCSYYRAGVGGTFGVSLRLGNISPLECICYKFNENNPQSNILWTHLSS
ncbi:MAG: hypothetical protein N2Z40_04210, partial [Caldimicrobium sp.]|nr:hypothetical protein [Caldimicrobium sp.]